jgi:hypothetical protein
MSSYPSHTASHHAPAEPRRGGLELSTLVIAGASSVVAALVVSHIWAAGTIWATAFTPVIVSLVKEALERPVQRVSAVATRAAAPPKLARAARTVAQPPPEASAPPPPMALDPALTERRVYGSRVGGLQRRWKLAVVTGLVAFVGVVAIFTLPELVAGRSVTTGSSHTTFFGGNSSRSTSSPSDATTSKDRTTTSKGETPTTSTPQSTTPTTTTPPAQPAPAPTTTTPAPTPTTAAPAAPAPTTTAPTTP